MSFKYVHVLNILLYLPKMLHIEMCILLQVVDLLIAMTRSACVSSRRDTIFTPYPTVVDPTKSGELAFNPKVISDEQSNVHA